MIYIIMYYRKLQKVPIGDNKAITYVWLLVGVQTMLYLPTCVLYRLYPTVLNWFIYTLVFKNYQNIIIMTLGT